MPLHRLLQSLHRLLQSLHRLLQSLHRLLQVQLVNTCGTFNVTRLAVGLMGKNEPDSDNQVELKGHGPHITCLHSAAWW